MTVDLSFFRSPTAERLRAEGRSEGIAGSILRALERRDLEVDAEAQQRIRTCADVEVLQCWLDRAVVAEPVDDLFT